MTQRKSIGAKLFIALIALTLISCCFLGSTFARYTSSDKGSASTSVAEWNIAGNFITGTAGSDSITVHFDGLTPSMEGYKENTNRTNSTGKILIATITNNGEVDAEVTLTTSDEASFVNSENSPVTFGSGYTFSDSSLSGSGASEEQVKALFSIALTYGTQEGASNATPVSGAIGLAVNKTIYVYATITWTTPYASSTSQGVLEDAVDTWVGQNVFGVAYDISYVAVQAGQSTPKA